MGLNISKPPDLLHLYLDFGKHSAPVTSTCEASTCDDFYKQEMEGLHNQLRKLVSDSFLYHIVVSVL